MKLIVFKSDFTISTFLFKLRISLPKYHRVKQLRKEMILMRHVIVIPAYKPELKLVKLVEELMNEDFEDIMVVDDGSGEEYGDIFETVKEYGAIVVRHDRNLGKGAAIKTGIMQAVRRFGTRMCVITADADGQHRPADIAWVSNTLDCNPGSLVLETRDFSGANVPKRSRFGNRLTSKVFKAMTGVACEDTQTGLRGIPQELIPLALSTEGTRYEYELNFLEAAAALVPFTTVPIETVYEDNNSGSHFRPVRDSLRVYGRPIRFMLSSLFSAGVDIGLFALLMCLPISGHVRLVAAATIGARVFSGVVNFLLNHFFSFKSKGRLKDEAPRYAMLFVIQMLLSSGFVAVLSAGLIPAVAAKLIVDTGLFFVSYEVQRKVIFAWRDNENRVKHRKEAGAYGRRKKSEGTKRAKHAA